MTNIFVRTIGTFGGENRSWLLSDFGNEPNEMPSVTLDISKFTAGTHYPNGYIPSGMVLGKVTSTGRYGPYDSTASDGRQTPAGFLFGSLPTGSGAPLLSGALVQMAQVDAAKLPSNSGLDTGARTALSRVIFTN